MATAAPPIQPVGLVGPPVNIPRASMAGSLMSWLPSWRPTSDECLAEAERKVLEVLDSDYREIHVPVGPDTYIHTVVFEASEPPEEPSIPLVMIHGFGCGIPQYYKNYDHLHSTRTVYSIDLPGFARSTRVSFTPEAEACEREYVEYIEKWRQEVGLDKFILLGHSLGGFLSSAYSITYPDHVRHLILDDPWGMPSRSVDGEHARRLPFWAVAVSSFLTKFNPLTPVRLAGPLGPYLIHRFRPDLGRKFGDDFMNYVYHVNAQSPTGESAFFYMQIPFGWARCPMLDRLPTQLPATVPLTLVYGVRSWMDSSSGETIKELRSDSYVTIHRVQGAGHHVHADQPEEFNDIINGVCLLVDSGKDTVD